MKNDFNTHHLLNIEKKLNRVGMLRLETEKMKLYSRDNEIIFPKVSVPDNLRGRLRRDVRDIAKTLKN